MRKLLSLLLPCAVAVGMGAVILGCNAIEGAGVAIPELTELELSVAVNEAKELKPEEALRISSLLDEEGNIMAEDGTTVIANVTENTITGLAECEREFADQKIKIYVTPAIIEQVVIPTASPAAGAVLSGDEITLSTTTQGASIYYTLNNTFPNKDSTLYSDSAKPVITANTILRAIALKTDATDSDELLTAYFTELPPPDTKYTVSFDSNGGSAVPDQQVVIGTTAVYPIEPTKENFFFDGWYNDSSYTVLYNFGKIYADTTLHAKWLDESAMIVKEFSTDGTTTFEVSTTAEWDSMVDYIKTTSDYVGPTYEGYDGVYTGNRRYVIKVSGDFSVAGVTSASFPLKSKIKILIYSMNNQTISLSSNGSMFFPDSTQSFIFRNITLEGLASNTDGMIYAPSSASGASIIIRPGTVIAGNTKSNGSGGGVYMVATGSTLTMTGGTIRGNKASSSGGGVYVNYGTFRMSGGTIAGNTVTNTSASSGGGVGVGAGTFVMTGGSITGNTAEGNYSNGGGVSLNGASTTFTMNGGTISDNSSLLASGGGVYVYMGTFTMNSGMLSGNSAATTGGGVYVSYDGEFVMKGGIVYGSGAGVGLPNTANTSGDTLFMYTGSYGQGTAKYGDVSDIITDGNSSTNETLIGHQ